MLEIYARQADSGKFDTGTGYLIDGGLVLTVSHVITAGPGTPIEVRFAASAQRWSCSLVWHRHTEKTGDGEAVRFDVALLRIEDALWIEPAGLPPLRWGRVVTAANSVPASFVGLPTGIDIRRDDGRLYQRDTAHVAGSLNTEATDEGYFRVTLDHSIPDHSRAPSRWKGASGAAFLVSGLLTGIAVTAEAEPGSGWIDILPVNALLDEQEFRDLVGPIDVRPAELVPVLDADEPRQAHSPVSLLSAESEVVRFHGRDDLVEDLVRWCESGDAFSARLITGQGGQGKTRLARHVAVKLRDQGWSTGFLSDLVHADELAVFGHLTTPLLLVVDYAEDRVDQLAALAGVLASARTRTSVRLLMLARVAGDWCDQLPLLAGRRTGAEVRLTELEPSPSDRTAALRDAVDDLASRLGEVTAYDEFDHTAALDIAWPDVSSDRYGCALNLHMAALVALLQAVDPVEVEKDEDDEAILLRHEQKFWRRTAKGFGLGGLTLATERRLVGAATLCHAEDEDEAVTLLDRLGVAVAGDPEFPQRVARWLASLYPADNAYWGPLHPDRLGEYLISVVIERSPDLLERLLPGATHRQSLRALRTLARADIHRRGVAAKIIDVVTRHADPLAFAVITAATTVEHPAPLSQALDALVRQGRFDTDLLSRLYDSTPVQSQALSRWASDLAERLANAATTEGGDAQWIGERLNNHAIRLAAEGKHHKALATSAESVAIRRRLAATGTAEDVHKLVLSLNTHANSLTDVGKFDAALAVSEEVLELCRKTADIDPEGQAMALYGLAVRQSNLGLADEAVESAAQSLRRYRELAEEDPVALRPDVALAMDNHALLLSEAGRHAVAVEVFGDAIALYRKLAEELPDAHEEDLARVLGSVATTMNELKRHDAALHAAEECVKLYRKLFEAVPDADPEWLAIALTTKVSCLSRLGRLPEAFAVHDEVVALYRRLAESAPDIYLVDFAGALHNKAVLVQQTGHDVDAVPLYDEALPVLRSLADSQPYMHGPRLALALNSYAQCLMALGDPEGALVVTEEATALSRRLVEHQSEVHRSTLVGCLVVRLAVLRALGLGTLALHCVEEAISSQRLLVDDNPEVEFPELSGMLHDRMNLLSDLGHRSAAAAAAEQHVTVVRQLADDDPDEYGPQLTTALTEYSIMLSDAGAGSVLPVVEEALERWRALAADDAHGYLQGIDVALHVRVVALSRSDLLAEAVEATEERMRLLRGPAQDDPDIFVPLLVSALTDHATVLMQTGRARDAFAASDRALELGVDVDDLDSDLALAQGVRARALSALGKHRKSLTAARASLRIWRRLAGEAPVLHGVDLATMLRTYAELLLVAGEPDGAKEVADEAVALFSALAKNEPDAFATDLKQALAVRRAIRDDR